MQKQLMMIVCASVGIAFCATAAISADDDLVAAVKERRDLMKKTVAPLFDPALNPEVPFTPPPGLRLFFKGEEPGGLPYLVYEFTSQFNP